MIGVVNYGGSPLFVLPTPGQEKYSRNTAVVDIDEAGPDDPFLWENSSTMIFPGFYDTYLSITEWVYNLVDYYSYDVRKLEENGEEVPEYYLKSWEDFEERYVDPHPKFYAAWEDYICKEYTRLMWERFLDRDKDHIITSMQYDHLWSPAYYNFETDKLVLRLTCNFDLLEKWIQEHLDDFRKYLKDVWSSYDGFISFVPNTYERLIDSIWYRKICLEYYIRGLMMADPYIDEDDEFYGSDEFYSSVEYKLWERLGEVFPEDIAAHAEELEAEE